MQHEGEPLGRRQPVEHHEQREPDRVREERLLLGVVPVGAGRDRLRCSRVDRLLPARLAGPQHVEAHARDDRRQPSAEVVDARGISAAQPQPRFLNGVVHVADEPSIR